MVLDSQNTVLNKETLFINSAPTDIYDRVYTCTCNHEGECLSVCVCVCVV